MMRSLIFIGILLLIMLPASGERVATLSGVLNPSMIFAEQDFIYIVQEATVFIFSRNNYELINSFGKRGEGPGEFRLGDDNVVDVSVQPDYLMVNSVGRISYFDRSGNFLRERINHSGKWLVPMGDHFVGMKRLYDKTGTRFRKLILFNQQLEEERLIYEEFDGIQPRLQIIEAVTWPSSRIYSVTAKRIFVADKDNTMYVYDETGEKLYEIELPFERIPVDTAVRERYLKFYREEEAYWRIRWERLKSWFRFPEKLPLVEHFIIKDQRIYILTFQQSNGESEFLVLDLTGKLIRRKLVPLKRNRDYSIFNIYPFDIKNDTAYQLVTNPDTEDVELHCYSLK